MNSSFDDYLWDPKATPVTEIESLERALQPLSARALKLDERTLKFTKSRNSSGAWRRWATAALAASVAFASFYALHLYRLSWRENSPWDVMISREGATSAMSVLKVGDRLVTTSTQTATLNVARIGTVVIAPESEATLVATRKGQHRIKLERGRLHAKIWAPPNYFGVAHGDAEFIDMGCEFDLQIDAPSTGRLTVASGWVFSQIGIEEVLVPEHYTMAFDRESAQVPTRSDASSEFQAWVNELAARPNDARADELAQWIAASARDEDFYTLHTLLRRHPQLARGPLYQRLAQALRVDGSEAHRERWAQADAAAMNEWWRYWPRQPKQWWLNWRDAF